jgi:uncharacterized membrane protein YebE (DUF533 family)
MSDLGTAALAIGLTLVGIAIAYDAFAAYRADKERRKEREQMERDIARWNFGGLKGTKKL